MRMAPLYLCADGGGTTVSVSLLDDHGQLVRGTAGACNVKSVGPHGAIQAILEATYAALDQLTGAVTAPGPDGDWLPVRSGQFARVWLGLAGIMQQLDVDAFAPYAREAFQVDGTALKITNDGHLLASACLRLPSVDTAIGLVAGTGTVGLAFKKSSIPNQLEQVGVSRGWGYLLCDEGSAYSIGRLAIRSILAHEDARQSVALSPSSVAPPRAMLNLHRDLLKYFDVPDTATLIDKVYSNHAPSANPRGYSSAEANRKIWIAEATRLVFARAFTSSKADEQEGGENFQSQQEAIAITTEAIKPLIDIVERLLGDRSVVVPSRSLLSLGGGLWKVDGYRNMLLNGLSELGIVFEQVIVVADASEEGVIALSMQCATTNGVH